MNVSSAEQAPTHTQGARHAMFTWQGADGRRLESVRVRWSAEDRFRCSGRVIVTGTAEQSAYSAFFELSVDETGVLRRALINSTCAEYERQLSLSRSIEGVWLVDDGSGVQRGPFEGAMEIDIQGVVLPNALPIRRLGLHHEAGEHTIPVVYVSLPDCTARVLQQTYRTISAVPAGADGAVIRYESGDVAADITVDADGMVLEYPGLARRVI
jgi:hypothetical protein